MSIISLLFDAKKKIDKWPSSAPDSGTVERNTRHLLEVMLNKLNSSCEYSGPQAVAYSLDLGANYTMHRRIFLFSDSAIEYVKDAQLQLLDKDSVENHSDRSSFSSGIYSDPDEPEDVDSDSSESETEPTTGPSLFANASTIRLHKQASQPNRLERPGSNQPALLPLSEEEEFGLPHMAPEEEPISDTDSDIPAETHQRIESLLKRSSGQQGSVPVVRNSKGELCIVTQAEDYRYRSEELRHYSLYELVNTTIRKDIKQLKEQDTVAKDQNLSDSSSDSDTSHTGNKHHHIDDNANDQPPPKQKPGRKSHKICYFQPQHQLADSHALSLRTIYTVSQFIRKVPAYPGPRPPVLTEPWKDRARKFAEFIMVVFCPWTGPHGLPDAMTWRAFCEYTQSLKESDTIVSRTRYAFILNCAHNLKFSSIVSKLLKQFRGSAATRWADMVRHLRPKRWLYGDETKFEQNIANKNTSQEAELAMADLINKICKQSATESKKEELLNSTISNYKRAIGAKQHTPAFKQFCMASLFKNDLPSLVDRLHCFSPELVNTVHDHNLIKQTDRALQEKIAHARKKNSAPIPPSKSTSAKDIIVWSPQQQKIITAVRNFIDKFISWKQKRSAPPDPLSAFIFGGPGIYSVYIHLDILTYL